jgi:hypothetical protein
MDLYKQTVTSWVKPVGEALAQPGDRIAEDKHSEDQHNVYEVLLVRNHKVVARALTDQGVEKGAKYLLPKTYHELHGATDLGGSAQLVLFRDPVKLAKQQKKTTAERTRAAPGESKIDKCKAIFAANRDAPKADLIKRFVEEVGCTPAGANTYYLTCKKTV